MMTVALIDSLDQVDLYFLLYGWSLRNMHGDGFERIIPLERCVAPEHPACVAEVCRWIV